MFNRIQFLVVVGLAVFLLAVFWNGFFGPAMESLFTAH